MSSNSEIERKWLMSESTAEALCVDMIHDKISQAYFGHACRVRITVDSDAVSTAEITVKLSKTALTRKEYNYSIPTSDAVEMLNRLASIHKHRFKLDNGFTLDVFKDELRGLYILEKEYQSEIEAHNDQLPDGWEAIDVTSTGTFVNSNLTGKRWDTTLGLIIDPGPINLQYGGEPFPPNIEFQLVTGDEDDIMPPPLVIP